MTLAIPHWSALFAAAFASVTFCGTAAADPKGAPTQYNDLTVAQLQAAMAAGTLTSEALTRYYLSRITLLDQGKRGVNAVIELNPDALAQAREADRLRRHGTQLGPLHGIPVLMKDNIGTGDRMQTTAGTLALAGAPAPSDATVVGKLRGGGAVLLGKTNLSEWANFRGFGSTSGWSARGGQTHNPYGLNRSPCGSSAGSGAAATGNFAAVTLATETDGSIVCPASVNGIVGLKPTVGLTSRAGAVPVSKTQDTIGVHARTVADSAVVLGVMQSRTFDGRDPATNGVPLGWTGRPRPTNIPSDYTQFLNPNGLFGARIGITRQGVDSAPAAVVAAWDAAVDRLRAAGATVIDLDASGFTFPSPDGEFLILMYEFRDGLAAYLATRSGVPLAGGTLADAIAFNNAHADVEMPFFGQEIFEMTESLAPGPNDAQPLFGGLSYTQGLEIDRLAGVNGIDRALRDYQLDGIVAPTFSPAWSTDQLFGDRFVYDTAWLAAAAGYPIVTVPAAMVDGLPMGISFLGTAFSEPTLIKLASGFEAVTQVRLNNPPTFALTMPNFDIAGTSPLKGGRSTPPAIGNAEKVHRPLPQRGL